MTYTPPFFLFNGHLETIYPHLFRRVVIPVPQYKRINTPDDDFLETYHWRQQGDQVIILSHGLEGNALRPYMLGMAQAFVKNGYDVINWSFRGCGTEMNRQLRFYHSGATDDLDVVVRYAKALGYRAIGLVGFSLGGNLTLKYLGERRERPDEIKVAVTYSVPMDLLTSCHQISKPENRVYANRFLRSLKNKIKTKAAVMSGLDLNGIDRINTLIDFDDRYTAPLHGFNDAFDYYHQCSAIGFVHTITIPTIIVNAKNDPFLSKACFPTHLNDHDYVQFISLKKGGHVGFTQFSKNGLYWSEERAIEFVNAAMTKTTSGTI